MNIERHLEELDEQGFTLLPGFLNHDMTSTIRRFMQDIMEERQRNEPERMLTTLAQRITHPIEDPIVARLASDPILIDLATRSLRAQNLRLRQQMFIMKLPSGKPPPATADGWHVDTVFHPEEWKDTPGKTFLQVFYYCNPVRSGGAATMVVPGSHKLTYAAAEAADCRTEENRRAFARDVIGNAGIDLSEAIEVTCNEGDVVLFNPMLLHSGSNNVKDEPRYIFHSSFHDASAERIRQFPPGLLDSFPPSMYEAMPEAFRPLLER